MTFDLPGEDSTFVPVGEAAVRMGLSVEALMDRVRAGELRARNGRFGLEVQPAIVTRHGPPSLR